MAHINVRVKVTPDSRKEKMVTKGKNTLTISVKEPAERGEATARVRVLVAQHYKVPLSHVRLHTGARSPRKVFSVRID